VALVSIVPATGLADESYLLRPLNSLSAALGDIAQGEGDLTQRFLPGHPVMDEFRSVWPAAF